MKKKRDVYSEAAMRYAIKNRTKLNWVEAIGYSDNPSPVVIAMSEDGCEEVAIFDLRDCYRKRQPLKGITKAFPQGYTTTEEAVSIYASKWEPCTAEEYHKIYNDTLLVYATYTNSDGADGLSYQPQMYTSWGDQHRELIRCEAKRDRDDNGGFTPWRYKHWRAVEWEEDVG